MFNNLTEETLALVKASLDPDSTLSKTITTGTGLLAFDLQAPAKNLYPFNTPVRNSIPRVGGGTGTATNWRQVNAILGSGFGGMGWVPEGQRSGQMSYNTSNKSAVFSTIGEEDAATFEAINAGRGFEDIQAKMVFRLLQKTMLKEENAILGGNVSIQLGAPATPTTSAVADVNSTLTTATYYVQVVALTYEGWANWKEAGSSLVAGIPISKIITGADGNQFTLNGGSSNISAEAAGVSITSGTNHLSMSTTAIQGAVAYAWYISSTSGAERLEAVTTINSYVRSTPLAGTGQLASLITADHSFNASNAFDGLLTAALNPANNAYVKLMATGTAGTGSTLTSTGRGSVVEIDTMFQSMWDNFQVSPTVLYVNSQELKNITSKVLNGSSSPILRYETPADGSAGEYQITASGVVQFYYNPYAINGGLRIPIKIHPVLPPGTIVGWAENLPIQYQSNEVPNVAEVKTRQDYYQIDWPIVTRQRQVGVYAEEVLAVYAPFAMGVITNIADG